MGLDAALEDDTVGLSGVFVDIHIAALVAADLDRFHAGADLAAAELLGHTVAFADSALALRRGVAMAAHGGNDEGNGAAGLAEIRDSLDGDILVGNAAGRAGNGDLHTRLHLGAEGLLRELALHIRGDILRV